MTRPASDHFNGKTFFYPGDTGSRGLVDVLRWKLTSKAKVWKRVAAITQRPAPASPRDGVSVSWIGHSTFLIQSPSGTFLTDPVFSKRASPFSNVGPQRAIAPGIAYSALPKIDAVLLSHDHYDHCDVGSLAALARDHQPILISPLGYERLLGGMGFKKHVALDWWEAHAESAWSVSFVPSKHWCRRWPWDTNRRLWGGFVLTVQGRTVYFVGDSGYDPSLFKAIRARTGPPDVALIPIGAYEPRWFMESSHMNPSEAVQVHRDMEAKVSVGMHWGTFQLTDEDREEPVADLAKATREAGLDPGEFIVLEPGASLNA